MTGVVRTAHHDGVDVATLDAPQTRNALSLAMLDDLRSFVASSATATSRALVIDHEGPAMSSGVDIEERRALPPGARTHSEALAALYCDLWAYPKPLLCRVAGAVRGGALGFLVCADAVVATDAASFAFSEVRIGVAPALVGALALAKFGPGTLPVWLMTGRAFDADAASAMGLVSDVVTGDGRRELEALLDDIRLAGPEAVATTKALARRFAHGPVAQLMDEMSVLSAEQFESAEGREGMAAFSEKRRPGWVGA